MSSAAVAVSLGIQEYQWFVFNKHKKLGYDFDGRPAQTWISWRRHVDDILGCSRAFCSRCVLKFIQEAFDVNISPVALSPTLEGLPDGPQHIGPWLDVDVWVSEGALQVIPKNVNRGWL